MELLISLSKGFLSSSGLLIAIGAQNAFVIRQGLKRQHLLLTASICSLIDAVLITFGVLGFGYYVVEYPLIIDFTKYFAVLFLFLYGVMSLRSALKKQPLKNLVDHYPADSVKKIASCLLALSLLNPHVYLDTVILLGSIASQQPTHERPYFALGAICASFVWFFSITFGARLLAPFFRNENSWRVIDGLISLVMFSIAINILLFG